MTTLFRIFPFHYQSSILPFPTDSCNVTYCAHTMRQINLPAQHAVRRRLPNQKYTRTHKQLTTNRTERHTKANRNKEQQSSVYEKFLWLGTGNLLLVLMLFLNEIFKLFYQIRLVYVFMD